MNISTTSEEGNASSVKEATTTSQNDFRAELSSQGSNRAIEDGEIWEGYDKSSARIDEIQEVNKTDRESLDLEIDSIQNRLFRHLFTVIETNVVRRTNDRRILDHDEIRISDGVPENRLDSITVDILFCHEASRKALSAFLGPHGKVSETCFIIQPC